MDYHRRLKRAAAWAVALHMALLLSPRGCGWDDEGLSFSLHHEPIVLALQRPEPEPVQRFIETAAPAQEPSKQTDLISDRDANAQDLSDGEGQRAAPFFAEPSDFDQLAAPLAQPDAFKQPRPAPPPPEPPGVAETRPEPPAEDPLPDDKEALKVAALVRPALPSPKTEIDNNPKAVEPKPATARPPELDPGVTSGRPDGGAPGVGFLNFEAKQHELAPYLREIRNRVEKQWRAALQIKYRGASPTEAVLECAISPDGRLLYVKVIEPGEAFMYAELCKEAIEKAAPFPSFPFEVPEVYRTKNLEILWTFSFT